MTWVAGLRSGILYTVAKRPLDPRWSQQDLHILLGHCANGLDMGWKEDRAFQAAEAIIMRSKNYGIHWSQNMLVKDIDTLLAVARKEHEA
jgi:hypothetical protein